MLRQIYVSVSFYGLQAKSSNSSSVESEKVDFEPQTLTLK